ncbi:MAG: radical SAM protein [Candidatus Methanoplasma sp.]|jgi:DNA repair photolyase|nr:radical SAM protein [Candidatus Methanoplasma sp.]
MNTTDLIEFAGREEWDGYYQVVECKRALSPSGLPEIDYALNPYGGCEHGCVYCYAPEVLHTEWKDWRVVKVRTNIADRLAKELVGLSGTIGIGTVTDPYQYAEKRFLLTHRCLEVLKARDFRIHVHTKSDLILRDLELIASMRGEVGITITTADERYSKMTEPGAPFPAKRLDALKKLTEAGIDTYALVGPVLNHLEGHEKELVDAIAATGTKRMSIDSLNSRPQLADRLFRMNICGSNRAKELVRSYAISAGIDVRDVF